MGAEGSAQAFLVMAVGRQSLESSSHKRKGFDFHSQPRNVIKIVLTTHF